MARHTPHHDIDENDVEVHGQKNAAAGRDRGRRLDEAGAEQMGPTRTARTLLKLNQTDGFDCMSCAWPDPDPDHRHTAEFCENGAKAVAEEATKARVGRDFFAQHSVEDLARSHGVLARQAGPDHRARWCCAPAPRTTRRSAGTTPSGSSPITCAGSTAPTRRCSTPPAARPTRPRSAYQLFARAFGTNNMPDCSNMCHESTSIALQEVDRHRQGQRDHRRTCTTPS